MALLRSVWQKLSGKTGKTANSPFSASTVLSSVNATLSSSVNTALSLASANPNQTEALPDQYAPLWHLLCQRQLIEVKIEGSSQSYQTLLMAIDIQRGLLWLDDLFPNQHALDIGDTITLRHHRNSEQLTFSAPVVAWGNTYGAQGLAIMLPEQVSYTPRRQYIRVDLSGAPSLGVKIRPIGQDISYGNVQDISSGGLRVSVPGNLLGQLRHGALLPLCELKLSDELHIRCSARVRAFRLVRNTQRSTHISIEFVDLAPERQLQLQQFINNLLYLQVPEERELRTA